MTNRVYSFVLGGKSRSRSAMTLGGVTVDLVSMQKRRVQIGGREYPLELRDYLDDAHDYDG